MRRDQVVYRSVPLFFLLLSCGRRPERAAPATPAAALDATGAHAHLQAHVIDGARMALRSTGLSGQRGRSWRKLTWTARWR